MKHSAGILAYRVVNKNPEILLIHTGGPYGLDESARTWSIPKGEIENGEDSFNTAIREFHEETGLEVARQEVKYLAFIEQSSMKDVEVYVIKKDFDLTSFKSNTFELEWPKGSGIVNTYPEADKIGYFSTEDARKMMFKGQVQLLDYLDLYMQGEGLGD